MTFGYSGSYDFAALGLKRGKRQVAWGSEPGQVCSGGGEKDVWVFWVWTPTPKTLSKQNFTMNKEKKTSKIIEKKKKHQPMSPVEKGLLSVAV